MDDAGLVRQVLAGNKEAYAELVVRWTGRVTALCHARLGRADLAEALFAAGTTWTPERRGQNLTDYHVSYLTLATDWAAAVFLRLVSAHMRGDDALALDAAAAAGKPYDAAIALGCVIRGDTIHFEIVSMESSRALMDLAVARKIPLGNGIVTVNTEAQAWARAKAAKLNKGGDAARAALAMLRIKRRLTRA